MLLAGRKYTEKEIEVLSGLFSDHLVTGFFQMSLKESILLETDEQSFAWLEYLAENLKVSRANQAFADQYGSDIQGILGRTLPEFFGHDDDQMFQALTKLQTEGTLSTVTHEKRLDGQEVIIKGEYFLLYDHKGWVKGLFGIQTDITQQVHIEQKREEENYLLAITEDLTESGSFEWNSSSQEQEYSDGIYKIFGLPKEQVINQEVFSSLIHPEDKDGFFEWTKDIYNNVENVSLVREFRIIQIDGTVKTLWTKVRKKFDNSNNLINVSGAIQDISERKRKEILTDVIYNISRYASELTNSHDYYQKIQSEICRLIDANNMFVAFLDEENDLLDIKYVTGESTKIKSLPAEGTISNLVLKENKGILLDHQTLINYDQTGKIKRVGKASKTWLGVPLRKGDRAFGVLVVQNYEKDHAFTYEDMELLEYISTQLVSAIRSQEDAEQIEVLRNSIEQSPVSVVITDLSGNIEYVNPKFLEITGYSLKEVIGENPRVLKSGLQTKEFYQDLWDTIAKGKEWRGEFQNKRKDGSVYWEMASISPVKNPGGQVTHYVAVKEDITLRKLMERDLLEAKEKAEESDNLKSAFLANLSHEIRTPMNGILGFSELLREEDLEKDEFNKYVDIISSNGNQLLTIIDDIITISNLEVKQLRINRRKFDLQPFLESLRYTFEIERKSLERHQVAILFPELKNEIILDTDQGKLNQILTNLLKNALKFTEKGTIQLSIETFEDGHIQFSVRDSGMGISEDMQKVIFDRFRQVDESNTRSFGGTGLGLAISKGLAELLGGDLWVESKLGEGSTFNFRLRI